MQIECKSCDHCKQIGRQQTQNYRLGRKKYYCYHPLTLKMTDRWGHPLNNFIGFGSMTADSPLVLKTAKRWCPLLVKGE